MLTTPRTMDCKNIWIARAAAARREGLNNLIVDVLRDNRPLPTLGTYESPVMNPGMEFCTKHKVSQEIRQCWTKSVDKDLLN